MFACFPFLFFFLFLHLCHSFIFYQKGASLWKPKDFDGVENFISDTINCFCLLRKIMFNWELKLTGWNVDVVKNTKFTISLTIP